MGCILMSISMILAVGIFLHNISPGLHRSQKLAHIINDLPLLGKERIAAGKVEVKKKREIGRC